MERNYYKERATEQANQLRIALISIAVALTAFLSKDINNSIEFATNKFLIISVIASTSAVFCGLFAWFFSSRMFYDLGEKNGKKLNHCLKEKLDILLALLLFIAIISSAIYLTKEHSPSYNKQIQPTSEMPLEEKLVYNEVMTNPYEAISTRRS